MTDLPAKQLIEAGDEALGMFKGCEVFFKFTCDRCHSRQTFGEPNIFYATGICEECGNEQEITEGGFSVLMTKKGPQP